MALLGLSEPFECSHWRHPRRRVMRDLPGVLALSKAHLHFEATPEK